MIRLCREKGLEAHKMDIEDLKLEDNSFDGVWAHTSLLHVPKAKLKNVLEKISGILKKDGMFFSAVKEGDSEGLQ